MQSHPLFTSALCVFEASTVPSTTTVGTIAIAGMLVAVLCCTALRTHALHHMLLALTGVAFQRGRWGWSGGGDR